MTKALSDTTFNLQYYYMKENQISSRNLKIKFLKFSGVGLKCYSPELESNIVTYMLYKSYCKKKGWTNLIDHHKMKELLNG